VILAYISKKLKDEEKFAIFSNIVIMKGDGVWKERILKL
jgi:hypothetical protein